MDTKEKPPFSFSFRKDELLAHYFGMTAEQMHADFDAGLDCIRRDKGEGDSFGAVLFRKAVDAIKAQSATNSANARVRWSREKPTEAEAKPTTVDAEVVKGTGEGAAESTTKQGDSAPISAPARRVPSPSPELKEEFEEFRKAYKGAKRGLAVEFNNLCRRYKAAEVVPLLMPALMREIAYHADCERLNAFCPEWANLATWINQARWTAEFPTVKAPFVRKTAEDLENEKKLKLVRYLKAKELGLTTARDYTQFEEPEVVDGMELIEDNTDEDAEADND